MKPGRGGASGGKMRITCSLDVACVMDCAGNSGARNLYVMGAMGYNGRLNKFPGASPGGMVLVSCKKGEPELRKKVLRGVVIRQRKAWRRKEGSRIIYVGRGSVFFSTRWDGAPDAPASYRGLSLTVSDSIGEKNT